jgi:hypothetical protein
MTRYGVKKTGGFAEYYYTGDGKKNPPGKLVTGGLGRRTKFIRALCDIILAIIPEGEVNCDEMLQSDVTPGPFPPEYIFLKGKEEKQ